MGEAPARRGGSLTGAPNSTESSLPYHLVFDMA
jgi:hypothetical protein